MNLVNPLAGAAIQPWVPPQYTPSAGMSLAKGIETGSVGGDVGLRLQAPSGTEEGSFDRVLGRMVDAVNDRQQVAGQAVQGLLAGQNVPLHEAMIAMEEASVSFQLMVEVRNKLLESYNELMRMQV